MARRIMLFALYFAALAALGALLGALLGSVGSPELDLPAILGAAVLLAGAAAMVAIVGLRR